MSLRQKISRWFRGSSSDQAAKDEQNKNVDPSLFDEIPPEIYRQMLSYMDVQSLKCCIGVSINWENELHRSGFLSQKSRNVWRGPRFESVEWGARMQKFKELITNADKIWTPEFCLEGFNEDGFAALVYAARNYTFQNVTHFELKKSSVKLVELKILLSKFDNLESFCLSETNFVAGNPLGIVSLIKSTIMGDDKVPTSISLKMLKIKLETIWQPEINFDPEILDRDLDLLGNYCTHLVHLILEKYDIGEKKLDKEKAWYKETLSIFVVVIINNAQTLKTLTLITFSYEKDRALNLYPNREDAGQNQGYVYKWFVKELTGFIDWDETGLKLEKLELKFRLVNTDDVENHEAFLDFLKTQKSLKEFNISSVHSPEPNQDIIDGFLSSLPEFCKVKIEGVQILRDQLNYVGRLLSYVGPTRPTPEQIPVLPPFHLPCVQLVTQTNPKNPFEPPPLLVLANGILMMHKHVNFLLQPKIEEKMVLGHLDSTAEFETPTINLTLRFVQASSIRDIQFMARSMKLLTKLRIQQVGIPFHRKIVINDGDLQKIISNAVNMTDLWIQFCNLSEVTDFGLTGISSDASERMWLLGNYDLQDGDLTGLPISAIKGLRSLRLTDVGALITDISAHHAFNGLNNLIHFGVFKPNMTQEGFSKIRDLFKYNQYIQLEPRTKMLLDHYASV